MSSDIDDLAHEQLRREINSREEFNSYCREIEGEIPEDKYEKLIERIREVNSLRDEEQVLLNKTKNGSENLNEEISKTAVKILKALNSANNLNNVEKKIGMNTSNASEEQLILYFVLESVNDYLIDNVLINDVANLHKIDERLRIRGKTPVEMAREKDNEEIMKEFVNTLKQRQPEKYKQTIEILGND